MTHEAKTEVRSVAAVAVEWRSAMPPDEMARLTDEIVGALKTIYDPEIPADIYELGLIYKVNIDDERMVNIENDADQPELSLGGGIAATDQKRGRRGARCA